MEFLTERPGGGGRHLPARVTFEVQERYRDWDRGPFTRQSEEHMSVYEVTAAPAG
jgi:hypothetical protein